MTAEEAQQLLDEIDAGIREADTESAWYGYISLEQVREALTQIIDAT